MYTFVFKRKGVHIFLDFYNHSYFNFESMKEVRSLEVLKDQSFRLITKLDIRLVEEGNSIKSLKNHRKQNNL